MVYKQSVTPTCASTPFAAVIPLKLHPSRHLRAVFIAQMAVGLHRQCAAVLMPEPAGDGWNVHTALNAPGSEEVAEVVVRDTSDAHDPRSAVDRPLAAFYLHNRF